MTYLAIRNYDRFQHYRDRRPVWVKLYVSLLQDKDYRALATTSRLVYVLLLLVASNRDNEIPNDAAWLSVEIGVPRALARKALDDLIAHGYLIRASDRASRPASELASDLATALSAETETEKESAVAVGTNGGIEADRELALTRLLASLKDKDEKTHLVVRGIVTDGRLAVGDIEWARECAAGPGVQSPTRVAVAELKKRSHAKEVA